MKKLLTSFCLLLSLVSLSSANAQLLYIEGKDYTVLANPLPLNKPGEKEVVEFFSYTCPHCYNLEPALMRWVAEKKPKDVGFYQVHATGGMWNFPARVKYVAAKLGLGHDFNQAYFDEIHKERNRRVIGDKATAVKFIAEKAGTDIAKVEKAWNSLQVKMALKRAAATWQQSGLQGVPAVVVNGEYLVQLTEYQRFFAIIDFLLATKSVPPVTEEATEKATQGATKETVQETVPKAAESATNAVKTAKQTTEKTQETVTEAVEKGVDATKASAVEAVTH